MKIKNKKRINDALLKFAENYGGRCYFSGVDRTRQLPDPKEFIDEFFKEIAASNL